MTVSQKLSLNQSGLSFSVCFFSASHDVLIKYFKCMSVSFILYLIDVCEIQTHFRRQEHLIKDLFYQNYDAMTYFSISIFYLSQ